MFKVVNGTAAGSRKLIVDEHAVKNSVYVHGTTSQADSEQNSVSQPDLCMFFNFGVSCLWFDCTDGLLALQAFIIRFP